MAGYWSVNTTETELISVNRWLLEFACFSSYHDFMSSGTVDSLTQRNFVQGILYRIQGQLGSTESLSYVHMLRLLCLLADGSEPESQYLDDDDTENITVLERALGEYAALTGQRKDEDIFSAEVTSYESHIRQQAVYVCCRVGDFEGAQSVYNRLWKPLENGAKETKEICKKIKLLIQKKTKEDKMLREYSYEAFIKRGQSLLHEIIERRFREPFLVSAARRVCAKLHPKRPTLGTEGEAKNNAISENNENKRNPEQRTEIKTDKRKEDDKESRTTLEKSEQLDKELNLVLDEKMFAEQSRLFGVTCSVKQLQQSQESKKKLEGKVDKIRKQDKHRCWAKLHKHLVEQPDYNSEVGCSSPSNARKKQGFEPEVEVAKKKSRPGAECSVLPEKSRSSSDGFIPDIGRTRTSEETEHEESSIRKHKLKRNINRQDRHARMPDLSPSPDVSDVSDISMSSLGPLHETVIDTFRCRSVKKKKRQTRLKWTEKEERLFFQGVMELGQGNWAEIKTWGHFHHRTSVHLKDKWRTLKNMPSRLKELERWYKATGGIATPERNQASTDSDLE